jgi:hypothetical protein
MSEQSYQSEQSFEDFAMVNHTCYWNREHSCLSASKTGGTCYQMKDLKGHCSEFGEMGNAAQHVQNSFTNLFADLSTMLN